MNSKLFTYGTLKKGFQRSPLLDSALYEKTTRTHIDNFLMYHNDYGNFPGMVLHPRSGGSYVSGELYQHVSDELLYSLDKVEGEPFSRIKILVGVDEPEWAWAYILSDTITMRHMREVYPDKQSNTITWS